jgi:hypothetical protein
MKISSPKAINWTLKQYGYIKGMRLPFEGKKIDMAHCLEKSWAAQDFDNSIYKKSGILKKMYIMARVMWAGIFFPSRESLVHAPAKQRGFSPLQKGKNLFNFAKESRSHDAGQYYLTNCCRPVWQVKKLANLTAYATAGYKSYNMMATKSPTMQRS